jgi:ubiquinone/menaquinone biosynthesis C-methylase UbiE
MMEDLKIKELVRNKYGEIASKESSCCESSGCGCGDSSQVFSSEDIGYSKEELGALPEGADLGLGCGNPLAHAAIKEGDTVLDLGSGAGIDCFLASQKVGDSGKVIGVDMTHEMLGKARENARKGDFSNVEFRLGEIENLPVADNSVDLVISNCVINLSTDKKRVFEEVYRVLKPGGKLMISDIVLLKPLDDFIKKSAEAYVGCVAGASLKEEYLSYIHSAGLTDVKITNENSLSMDWLNNETLSQEKINNALNSIVSIKVSAMKPSH